MELRGIVPAIVPAPPPEPFAVQVIIVDWLYREVDGLVADSTNSTAFARIWLRGEQVPRRPEYFPRRSGLACSRAIN
jgi:hypothetical protein